MAVVIAMGCRRAEPTEKRSLSRASGAPAEAGSPSGSGADALVPDSSDPGSEVACDFPTSVPIQIAGAKHRAAILDCHDADAKNYEAYLELVREDELLSVEDDDPTRRLRVSTRVEDTESSAWPRIPAVLVAPTGDGVAIVLVSTRQGNSTWDTVTAYNFVGTWQPVGSTSNNSVEVELEGVDDDSEGVDDDAESQPVKSIVVSTCDGPDIEDCTRENRRLVRERWRWTGRKLERSPTK